MKSPIPYTYDLNTKSAQKVICVTHTDDNSVDVIQLHVVQNGALIDFSGNTIIARMVMSRTHELLSDNVVCTIDEVTKDIMIPIDRKAVSTRKGLMLIEVNVRGVLPEKLTLQFPLLVRVNGSILDDAEITPESQGTIPELLIAAAEELRRVQGFITSDDVYDILDSTLQGAQNVAPSLYVMRKGDNYALVYEDSEDVLHELFDFSNLPSGASDYADLENKPQINSVTLLGNKSSDDLGLQKKLTAGTNITIESDGTISASGGVTSYNNLTDQPNVSNYAPNQQEQIHPLMGTLDLYPFISSYNSSTKKNSLRLDSSQLFEAFKAPFTIYNFEDLPTSHGVFACYYADSGYFTPLPDFIKPLYNFLVVYNLYTGTGQGLAQLLFWKGKNDGKAKAAFRVSAGNYNTVSPWREISGGSQIVSGVVNQNGTITFTDSDGNTFTTTGSSVIGADGFSPTATVTQTASGATVSITDSTGTTTANISNGNDYVLTAQDKSDIADIVLSELPTTQGVLYGNTSN